MVPGIPAYKSVPQQLIMHIRWSLNSVFSFAPPVTQHYKCVRDLSALIQLLWKALAASELADEFSLGLKYFIFHVCNKISISTLHWQQICKWRLLGLPSDTKSALVLVSFLFKPQIYSLHYFLP